MAILKVLHLTNLCCTEGWRSRATSLTCPSLSEVSALNLDFVYFYMDNIWLNRKRHKVISMNHVHTVQMERGCTGSEKKKKHSENIKKILTPQTFFFHMANIAASLISPFYQSWVHRQFRLWIESGQIFLILKRSSGKKTWSFQHFKSANKITGGKGLFLIISSADLACNLCDKI